MEVIGKIKVVGSHQQISDKFKKRELVVTTDEQYPQMIMIEFTQDKCEYLDDYRAGEAVKVSINLKGREWINPKGEAKYFNSIQGWRIERLEQNGVQGPPPAPADEYAPPIGNPSSFEEDEKSDLPF